MHLINPSTPRTDAHTLTSKADVQRKIADVRKKLERIRNLRYAYNAVYYDTDGMTWDAQAELKEYTDRLAQL